MKTVQQLIIESINNEPSSEKTASVSFNKEEALKVSSGLEKVASLPYKEEAYLSTCEIMKIASSYLRESLNALEEAHEKIAEQDKINKVRQIVDEMQDNGLIDRSSAQEKVAELANKSNHELEVVKEAVDMHAGRSGNIFFDDDMSKTAQSTTKRGMFDDVLG